MSHLILPSYAEADVQRADAFAEKMHQGQIRKMTGKPYITHPRCVEKLIIEYAGLTGQSLLRARIASILHDTIEDTHTTQGDILLQFGSVMGMMIQALTSDQTIACDGESHLPRVRDKVARVRQYCMYETQLVMLADRGANIEELVLDWSHAKKQSYTQDEPEYMLQNLDVPKSNELAQYVRNLMEECRKTHSLAPPTP